MLFTVLLLLLCVTFLFWCCLCLLLLGYSFLFWCCLCGVVGYSFLFVLLLLHVTGLQLFVCGGVWCLAPDKLFITSSLTPALPVSSMFAGSHEGLVKYPDNLNIKGQLGYLASSLTTSLS